MNAEVGALVFVFFRKANAGRSFEEPVHDKSADDGDHDAQCGTDELRSETHAADAAECRLAENAGRDAAPYTAHPV